jgi:hypothetical protein
MALLLVLWAPVAGAQVTEASSTTLFRIEPVWLAGDTRTTYSATEFVNLSMRAIDLPGVQDLRLQLSAWATGGLVSSGPDGILIGDVQLLTLTGSLFDHHLNLTLGRQLVTGGAARALQLDGVNASVNIAAGFGFNAYIGAPTPSPLATGPGIYAYVGAPSVNRGVVPIGDFAFGGRAFWRPSFGSEVGISFNEVLDEGVLARQDLGLDLHYAILSNLGVSASGIFSLAEMQVADAEVSLSWQILPTLELSAKGQYSMPELSLPLTSIFTVFAYPERTAVGGSVFWQALPRLSIYGEYEQLWVDGGSGNEADLKVTYKFNRSSTLGVNGRLLLVPVNGYTDARAWFLQTLTDKFRLSADLDWIWLQNPINQVRDSVVGTASFNWIIGSGWTAMLSASGGTTTLYSTVFTATARVSYDFAAAEKGARR